MLDLHPTKQNAMRKLFHDTNKRGHSVEEGHISRHSTRRSPNRPFWPIYFYCLLFITLTTLLDACDNDSGRIAPEQFSQAITELSLKAADGTSIESLDIFFFNDDSLGRLDSWQRIEGAPSKIQGGSRSGRKILTIIANVPQGSFEWNTVSSYASLASSVSHLKDEDPQRPVMSASMKINAGTPVSMRLSPLMARVLLRTISCDFNGRPYQGASLTDVKAYLTNVNGICQILPPDTTVPEDIINNGSLRENDMQSFSTPSMLEGRLPDIGQPVQSPDLSLFCYPNEIEEESLGQPFTRLVIEGRINGKKYYYPLNINQEDFGYTSGKHGLSNGLTYAIDLTITRAGSLDPDTPVAGSTVKFICTPQPWAQKDNIVVPFILRPMAASAVTKSSDPDENRIEDVNLFLFGADSMLCEKRFYAGKDIRRENGLPVAGISLLKDCKYNIFTVANAGFNLVGINTWEDLMAYRKHLAYPDEFSRGIPMSGKIENFSCSGKEPLSIPLYRMMAKISIRMDRSALDAGVKMNVASVTIGNCPNSALAFAPSRVANESQRFSKGYFKSLAGADNLNIGDDGGLSREVSLYSMENLQGDDRDGLRSYVEMELEYQSAKEYTGAGKNLIYRFFLGDGKGNHDVERNCEYHFTVKPEGNGLMTEDSWRVDKSGLTAFTSGSITLHPGSYVERKVGEDVHVWAEVVPPLAPFDIGLEELEFDRERGIYDYEIDEDGHGVTLHLKSRGSGILYFEAGEPVNDSVACWIQVEG